ncbi:hypothetical protein ACWGJ9_07470 [Curtobacterium citreum]
MLKLTIATATAALAVLALAGCSANPGASTPTHSATAKAAAAAPTESHAMQCARIATWSNNVYDADKTPSSTPSVSADFRQQASQLVDDARPELGQAMRSADGALHPSFDVTAYNTAMDGLSAACSDTGLSGAFTKYQVPSAPAASTPEPSLTLSVTGSGSAQVIWTTPAGSQQHTVDLPWSTTVPLDSSTIILAATNTSGATTPIGCTIAQADHVFSTNQSSGAYATVTCTKS